MQDAQIQDERTRLAALDSKLDATRTPFMKNQLRLASHLLDDAESALGFAKANVGHASMWLGFGEINIRAAAQLRQKVQEYVDNYGGPEHVTEIGG